MSAKTSSRKRSAFSYTTNAGTTLALVFAYLNGELCKSFSRREGKLRARDALEAFWKPYALKADGMSADEVKQSARYSVESLSRQIRIICEDFSLDAPFDVRNNGYDLEMLLQTLATHMNASNGATNSTVNDGQGDRPLMKTSTLDHSPHTSNLNLVREVIFVNDEELLGDLG